MDAVGLVEGDGVGDRQAVAERGVGDRDHHRARGQGVLARVLGIDDDGPAARRQHGGACATGREGVVLIAVGEHQPGQVEVVEAGVVELDELAGVLVQGVGHDLVELQAAAGAAAGPLRRPRLSPPAQAVSAATQLVAVSPAA